MDLNGSKIESTSPKKEIKMLNLQWISKADRKKSPMKNRNYNLRIRKPSAKLPKNSQKENSNQQKINSFFKKPLNLPATKHNCKKFEQSPIKPVDDPDDLYLSPSARLDSLVPKVEDILRAREQEKKLKEIHAMIEKSSKKFLQGLKNSMTPSNFEKKETPVDYKDCKHLSLQEIAAGFKKDLNYLDDIFYGRVYNERLEIFKKDTPLNNGTKHDLRVNDTTCAFTQDQLLHIIGLFRDRYDDGNIYKYSDLYFKVLLPEYCLKIFSENYKMHKDDALKYLKAIPVQDVFDLD